MEWAVRTKDIKKLEKHARTRAERRMLGEDPFRIMAFFHKCIRKSLKELKTKCRAGSS